MLQMVYRVLIEKFIGQKISKRMCEHKNLGAHVADEKHAMKIRNEGGKK